MTNPTYSNGSETIMTFELDTKTKLRLLNVNPRRERHGDENVPAVDLKLRLEASNDVLSMFDGHLKSALYFRNGVAPDQGGLDGVPDVSDMPNLRFPKLEPLRWDSEQIGCEFSIDHGLGGKSDLTLDGCAVNNFVIEPKEGGTVVVTFRVQCDSIHERELGKLCTMIDSNIEATLSGPPDA